MAKPDSKGTSWANAGDRTEPSDGEKNLGFIEDQRPDPEKTNWWWWLTDEWISYLDDAFHVEHEVDGAHSPLFCVTDYLDDLAVTADKIADDAVGTDQIDDGAVTTAKIALGAVDTDQLADEAVTSAKIAPLAVTADKIADDAITNDHLTDDCVGAAEIDDEAVTNDKLAADAIQRDGTAAEAMNLMRCTSGLNGMYGWRKITAADVVAGTPDSEWTADEDGYGAAGTPDIGYTKAGAVVFSGIVSERIPVGPAVWLALTCYRMLQAVTNPTGTIGVRLEAFRNVGGVETFISSVVTLTSNATGAWELLSGTGETPALTEWVRVKLSVAGVDAVTDFRIRDIQVNEGTVAAVFNTGGAAPRKVHFRYHHQAAPAQSIANATLTILNFNAQSLDGPFGPRVTTGANWKFTADRHMVMRVSAAVIVQPTAGSWNATEYIYLDLYKNGTKYCRLGWYIFETSGSTNQKQVQGKDLVELERGDYIDARIYVTIGALGTLDVGIDGASYIAGEEI